MTRILEYRCNICDELIDNPNQSFGINFKSPILFNLGGYGSTDHIHICYRCARQLKSHLNCEEISKLLDEN